jgi:hypothetical protein
VGRPLIWTKLHYYIKTIQSKTDEKNRKKTRQKYWTNEKGIIATSYCNNDHKSKQRMEEAQRRKVYGTKIILPTLFKQNLNPLGPTD